MVRRKGLWQVWKQVSWLLAAAAASSVLLWLLTLVGESLKQQELGRDCSPKMVIICLDLISSFTYFCLLFVSRNSLGINYSPLLSYWFGENRTTSSLQNTISAKSWERLDKASLIQPLWQQQFLCWFTWWDAVRRDGLCAAWAVYLII